MAQLRRAPALALTVGLAMATPPVVRALLEPFGVH